MTNTLRPNHYEALTTEARATDATTLFGFWVYLMTDFVLFASLFAVYAVLRGNTFEGPAGSQLFDLPFVLIETILLLTSSFTYGLALLAARAGSRNYTITALALTAILGLSFVVMEISEFIRLIGAGSGPARSGFLSSYFALVGTHGLHVALGLVWMIVLMIALMRRGFTRPTMRKLMLLGMFWHFLDIIWIFIFTIVYLMGAT